MTFDSDILKRRLKVAILAALFLCTAFAAFAILANVWVVQSTRDHVYSRVEDAPERRVAIVPGARIYASSGRPSPALRDRLQTALDLYTTGKVQKILVSGDNGSPYYDEVTVMRKWLIRNGAEPRDVVRDHAGFRTLDTMQRAERIFGVRDAVVCTQRFHLNRSVFLARDAGMDAVGVAADRRPDPNARFNALREATARIIAVLDTHVWFREPRFWGPPEDLGD